MIDDFRVWFPQHKRMDYDISLAYMWRNGVECTLCQVHPKPTMKNMGKMPIWMKSAIFMQYINRKDENGNKIYEDDIVTYFQHEDFTIDKKEKKKSVIGITLNTCLDECASGGMDGRTWVTDIKIIGNIHENPEILK